MLLNYDGWCLHPANDLLMIITMMGEVHHTRYDLLIWAKIMPQSMLYKKLFHNDECISLHHKECGYKQGIQK